MPFLLLLDSEPGNNHAKSETRARNSSREESRLGYGGSSYPVVPEHIYRVGGCWPEEIAQTLNDALA